jgi:diguanylate cyclase (GGDEF)-like protein
MSKHSLLQELTVILGLALLGAAAILAGTKTSTAIIETQLANHGEAIAARWSDHFKRESRDLRQIFLKREVRAETKQIFLLMGKLSPIFRFELFDQRGNLIHTSASAEIGDITNAVDSPFLGPTAQEAHQGPVTQVIRQPDGAWPSRYAVVTIPVRSGDTFLGSVRSFVDLTRQAGEMSKAFGLIAAITGALIIVAVGVPTLIVGLKIHQQWKAEAQIRYLSQHDKLTGLFNREAFSEHLSEWFKNANEMTDTISLICIDVDRHNEIIETLGHATGDALLQVIARRMRRIAGDELTLGRMDGDEFAIALEGADRNDIEELIAKLQAGLSRTYLVNGEDISCTVCMGIATAPTDAQDAAMLLRKAEVAVKNAYTDGFNVVRFFEPALDTAYLERRQREKEMRDALANDGFDMHYQPKIDLRTGEICGHEALVRWFHPVHGAVSPAYFIPIAEETELIVPLGEWIIRRACRDAANWPEPRNIAVNLSPVQFERISVTDMVSQALKESGLPPERLEIEITENLLMSDAEDVLGEFKKLRDLGVGIAMDDFGTGYSSLSYISRFPLTTIKLDRCFVNRLDRDEGAQAIVRCIIDLGHALGIDIFAEGVETPAQATLLRELGCNFAQGYLFGRPASKVEAIKRLQRVATTKSDAPESAEPASPLAPSLA